MTNGSWVARSALVGLLATSAAQADFTIVDPDPYAPGTDISNVFDGVTLSHLTWNGGAYQASAVYSASCGAGGTLCNAAVFASFGWQTPTGTFNRQWTGPGMSNVAICLADPTQSFCSSPAQHILEVAFDTDTDFIQFDSSYTHTNTPEVLAFDAAGNIVAVTMQATTLATYVPGPWVVLGHQVITVTSATANIKRLWIAGSGNTNVNDFTFKKPATTCPIEEIPQ